MTSKTPDFAFVRRLLAERTGIALDASKEYLITARLGPAARAAGFADPEELIDRARRRDADACRTIVAALATHETMFFRDPQVFALLRTHILPELIDARRRDRQLRIWCAACSTGQEPYSVAMLLAESFPELATWNVEIVGTDFVPEVLDEARNASYPQLAVNRGLPATSLARWFKRYGTRWELAPEIRARVEFRLHNLVHDAPPVHDLDLVLMRNVLIYFAPETRQRVVATIERALGRHGALVLGATETLAGSGANLQQRVLEGASFYAHPEFARVATEKGRA